MTRAKHQAAMGRTIWRKVAAGNFDCNVWYGDTPYLANETTEGIHPALTAEIADLQNTLRKSTRKSVIFDITNVADFLYTASDQEEWDWNADFPCLAPPYPAAWFEWAAPWVINSAGVLTEYPVVRGIRYGAQVETVKGDDGWLMCMAVFGLAPASDRPVLHGLMMFVLDDRGVPAEPHRVTVLNDPSYPARQDNISQMAFAVGLAISFLHCKNVMIDEHTVDVSKRRALKDERRGIPQLTYRTLDIGPISRAIRSHQPTPTTGFKKALHICRGHFAEYTEDKPLFGKYSGRFWIPAHVRGSAEAGRVVKDYRVVPPTQNGEAA